MDISTGFIGSFLLFLMVVIVVFLLLRELIMWYWKINTIITNQNETNKLLKSIFFKLDLVNSENKDPESSNQENILIKIKKSTDYELEEIIKSYKSYSSKEVFLALGILKKRNSLPPFAIITDIRDHYNFDSYDALWEEVTLLLNENN